MKGAPAYCSILICILASHASEAISSVGTEGDDRSPSGQAVFAKHCAQCHENESIGAPAKNVLQLSMTATSIYAALTQGRMRLQAASLSPQERRDVAEYLAGGRLDERPWSRPPSCPSRGLWFDYRLGSVGVGWGIDAENTRFIPAELAGITASDLEHLKVSWVFAYPSSVTRAGAQPLIAGGGLFVGSQDGTVYALDARSGCLHWTFKAHAEIAGGLVLQRVAPHSDPISERPMLFFADRLAYVYAVDAATGALRWSEKVDDHPAAGVVGTPVLMDNRLYVPVVSAEENSVNANYSCCTFRGSMVAIAAETGKKIWKRYAIPSPAVEQYKNATGKAQFGPSGAGIWGSPAVDRQRHQLYFATGNSYSDPGDDNSNAIFAIDLTSGIVRWRTQTFAGDNWNGWDFACRQTAPGRSPSSMCTKLRAPGPDIDLSTSPILVHGKQGRDIVIVGRKDGTAFGLDPDNGSILWQTRTTSNSNYHASALYFGLSVQNELVFIPSVGTVGPFPISASPSSDDGLHAVDAFAGTKVWKAPVIDDCKHKDSCRGIMSAPIGIPGVVFAGAADGTVRGYESTSGRVLWRFDTAREFSALSGSVGKGGAVSRNGIMIARGMVYINSGYMGNPGNVLLAFAVMKDRR